tara:strand:+ start:434 stop:1309 length:876 start_codon:yes stop_codon:yes gene_type:complete
MTPVEAAAVCRDVLAFDRLSNRPDQLFHRLEGLDDYAMFWITLSQGVKVFRLRWEEVVAGGFLAGSQLDGDLLTSSTATDSAIDHYEGVLQHAMDLIEACNLAYAFRASSLLSKLQLPEGLAKLIEAERRFILERDHRRGGGNSAKATAVAAVNNQIEVSLNPSFNVAVHTPVQEQKEDPPQPRKEPESGTSPVEKPGPREPSLADRSAYFALRALDAHVQKYYENAHQRDLPTTRQQKRDLIATVIDTWERADLNIGDDWLVPETGGALFVSAKRFKDWIDAGNPDIIGR